MDLGKISDYPDHREPTFPAGEYEREEKPRVNPRSIAIWGTLILLIAILAPLMPTIVLIVLDLFGVKVKW